MFSEYCISPFLLAIGIHGEACTTRFFIVKKKPQKSGMYRRGGLTQGDKQKIDICSLWSSSSREYGDLAALN